MRFTWLGLVLVLTVAPAWGSGPQMDYQHGYWTNKPELSACRDFLLHRTRSLRPPIQQFVMGPLERVVDWDAFSRRLAVLKSLGVHAITTDIYWGWVEPAEGRFDWSYYREYLRRVRAAGLRWVPIFSFHKIGGNVGDNVDIAIPSWAWAKFPDGRFIDRHGRQSDEYIHFLESGAYDLYERVMESFRNEFWSERAGIAKIYTGLGPAGELRYPSYIPAFGWVYPQRGELQTFGARAEASFRAFLEARYGNIAALNAAWDWKFSSFEDPRIRPPTDGDHFFKTTQGNAYRRDFLDWQQFVMENHLFEMLHRARRVFLPFQAFTADEQDLIKHQTSNALTLFYGPTAMAEGQRPHFTREKAHHDARIYWKFRSLQWRLKNPCPDRPDFLTSDAAIGAKLAGIHWLHSHPEMPRAAAQTAGYDSYDVLLSLIRVLGATATFTCMEMTDRGDGYPESYSEPRSLVGEIAELAQFLDLPLNGENALSMDGNVAGYENLEKVFRELELHGFTLLRMGDLVDAEGTPTPNAESYRASISARRGTQFYYPSDLEPGSLEVRGWEMRILSDDPLMQLAPLENSVRMTYRGSAVWGAEMEIGQPTRLSWKVLLVDTRERKILGETQWMRPEHLSTYVWNDELGERLVVRLPDADFR